MLNDDRVAMPIKSSLTSLISFQFAFHSKSIIIIHLLQVLIVVLCNTDKETALEHEYF